MRLYMLVALAALTLSAPLRGQQPLPTATECQNGIDSLQGGSRTAGAWLFLQHCGDAGVAALAVRLTTLGSETDTVYLANLLWPLTSVRDTGVFRASRTVANNTSATVAARATALQVMLTQYAPGGDLISTNGWAHFIGTPRGLSCQVASFVTTPAYSSAFPPDYLTHMAATLDSIVFRAGEQPVIRDLAGCVRLAIQSKVPLATPASALTFTYVCGTRFRATNSSSRLANLRFRLVGSTEEFGLVVPANGAMGFSTMKAGPVEVLQTGAVIATLKNGGTGCP